MNHFEFLTQIDSRGCLDEDEHKMVTLNPNQKLDSQINDYQ